MYIHRGYEEAGWEGRKKGRKDVFLFLFISAFASALEMLGDACRECHPVVFASRPPGFLTEPEPERQDEECPVFLMKSFQTGSEAMDDAFESKVIVDLFIAV